MGPSPQEVALTALVVIVIAGVLGAVINRFLHYRETVKLAELGSNSAAHLMLRERWLTRRGLLGGVRTFAAGAAVLIALAAYGRLTRGHPPFQTNLPGPNGMLTEQVMLTVLTGLGWFLVLIGGISGLAHWAWARQQWAPGSGPEQERRRLHRGTIGGLVVMLAGVAMFLLAVVYGVLMTDANIRWELQRLVGFSPFGEAMYLLIAGLLFVLGAIIGLAYAWAGCRFRRRQQSAGGEERRA